MTTPEIIERVVEQLLNSQRSPRQRQPVTPGVYGLFVQAYDGSAENPGYIDEWKLFIYRHDSRRVRGPKPFRILAQWASVSTTIAGCLAQG